MPRLREKTPRQPRIFISHASNDKPAVRKLYSRLVHSGFDVWLDEEKLLPGQDWQVEISKAVLASDIVLVCLSKQSVAKEGFVKKEISMALEIADQLGESMFFVIPVKLEECQMPSRLNKLSWVNLFEDNGYAKLEKTLLFRTNALNEPPKNLSLDHVEALEMALTLARREMTKLEQEATAYTVLTIPVHLVKRLEDTRHDVNILEKELSKIIQPQESRKIESSAFSRHDIFLSYSRKDVEIMSRIKADLEQEGFDVWVDQTELELGTVAWETKIQDALERTGCVVVLMSPDSQKSKWVMNELSYAERHNVRIFPVLARGDEIDAVPFRLSSTMWVDIREDYAKALQKLVGAIKKQVSAEVVS